MKICKMNDRKIAFVTAAREMLGANRTIINRPEIRAVLAQYNLPNCSWLKSSKFRKVRGEYWLPTVDGQYAQDAIPTPLDQVAAEVSATVQMAPSDDGVMEEQDSNIPEKFVGYVPWGNFNTIKDEIKSNI